MLIKFSNERNDFYSMESQNINSLKEFVRRIVVGSKTLPVFSSAEEMKLVAYIHKDGDRCDHWWE